MPQVFLSELTTMGVGGPASRLVSADTEGALVDAVREADGRGEPVLLVGGGSNLVVADEGFPGLVVMVRTSGFSAHGSLLTVAAGESWDALVAFAVTRDLAGIECLAGIPGLVGASPIQNVGAYGQEVSSVITRVRAFDRHAAEFIDLTPAECGFAYRSSRFKVETGRWVVTEVDFALNPGELSGPVRYAELARAVGGDSGVPVAHIRETVLALRRSKGMVLDPSDPDTRSSGSFFTNPILDADAYAALVERAGREVPSYPEPEGTFKVPAAWLIDHAGFAKGYGTGARLSSKHALAVTNPGGASATQVVALAREIRDGVRERFGITLVNEPVLVGLTL